MKSCMALRGLAKALAFEKNRGVVDKQDRMQVFLVCFGYPYGPSRMGQTLAQGQIGRN